MLNAMAKMQNAADLFRRGCKTRFLAGGAMQKTTRPLLPPLFRGFAPVKRVFLKVPKFLLGRPDPVGRQSWPDDAYAVRPTVFARFPIEPGF